MFAPKLLFCRKFMLYLRQNNAIITMQSIDDKILSKAQKCGRGKVYFSTDFAAYGAAKSVAKALERMVKAGQIVRLSQGIYYYPQIDKELGLGVLYPSLETIAQSIAERDKAKIVPTGLYALNRLGLSPQVPMNIVYLTNGSPRSINIGNGRGIRFKLTVPKNLAFQNELAMLITFALKELKKENVTPEHLEKIKGLLRNEPKEKIMADAPLMPAWVRSIVMKSYE
jgi:hypothetical protein